MPTRDPPPQSLRDAQADLSAARDRLKVVEDQLNTDHRALNRTEAQYRDQLTERNTLLLTIYQYMDKMVPERSPVRPAPQPQPCPWVATYQRSRRGRAVPIPSRSPTSTSSTTRSSAASRP